MYTPDCLNGASNLFFGSVFMTSLSLGLKEVSRELTSSSEFRSNLLYILANFSFGIYFVTFISANVFTFERLKVEKACC